YLVRAQHAVERRKIAGREHEINEGARAAPPLARARERRMVDLETGAINLAEVAAFGVSFELEALDDASCSVVHAPDPYLERVTFSHGGCEKPPFRERLVARGRRRPRP